MNTNAVGRSRRENSGRTILSPIDLTAPPEIVAPQLLGAVLRHTSTGGPYPGTVAVMLTEVEAYPGEGDPASHTFKGWTPRCATMFGPPGHLYVYASYGIHRAGNIVCRPEGIGAGVLMRAGRVIDGVDLVRARRRRIGREGKFVIPEDDALARGPGNLGAALGLDLELNGAEITQVVDVSGAVGSSERSAEFGGSGGSELPGSPGGFEDFELSGGSGGSARPAKSVDSKHPGDFGDSARPDHSAEFGSPRGLNKFTLTPPESPVEVVTGPRIGISKNQEAPLRFWIPGDRTVSPPRRPR